MNLTLRTEYWDDPEARAAFKKFLAEIHGLDLAKWERQGYWDNAYTPFSFFDGDRIVSSVCVYLLDAVINGEAVRLAQISGVGTRPEWRRKGLNRELTEIGLDWARGKHQGIFLFSDADAIPFYEAMGFSPIEEFVEIVEAVTVPVRREAVRLDVGSSGDLEKIYEYARKRAPVSDRFGILNAKLVMFHVLYFLRDHVYEIPELDCIVFFKRDGGLLKVFDILAERIPRWNDLYPYLADGSDKTVEFHFHEDRLGLDGIGTRPLSGNNPFVRDPFPVDRPVFPCTSRA